MSWKKIKKGYAPVGGLSSGEMQLRKEPDGKWRLEQFMRGAHQISYSEEHMNRAIQQVGTTWDKANTNHEDGKAVEVYLNNNNSSYGLDAEQRMDFLNNFRGN